MIKKSKKKLKNIQKGYFSLQAIHYNKLVRSICKCIKLSNNVFQY